MASIDRRDVEVIGTTGPDLDRVLILYTGGTIGMATTADGALAPLDLRELRTHLPVLDRLPIGLTLATFPQPIDSSTIRPDDWLRIADAIVDLGPGHAGVVVLHGTDTLAFTTSALSFLLEDLDLPVVCTGAQRPLTSLRSDGRENVVTALEIAAGHRWGSPIVAEVTVFFADVLLRGNRTVKAHADSYRGFESPNLSPLATAGVSVEFATDLIRPPGPGPVRRSRGICEDVAAIRLHPGLDRYTLDAVLARPGLRGVVLEAYGAGNGPDSAWFLDGIARAVASGVVVVMTTQCRAGAVLPGQYATGAALVDAGVIPGRDLTFEAALTKTMVLADRHGPEDLARLLITDLAGELTVPPTRSQDRRPDADRPDAQQRGAP